MYPDVDSPASLGEPEASDPIGDRSRYRPLKEAINAIASVCDGARERDEVGFNGADAPLGRLLAFLPLELWPPEAFREAWTMLRTYRNRQLPFHGIVYADLPEPPDLSQQEGGSRYITRREDGTFLVLFPASAKLERAFARIPGGEKRTTPARYFLVQPMPGAGAALLRFAERHGFIFAPGVQEQARRLDYQVLLEENGMFGVYFPHDEAMNAEIKAIPGRGCAYQPRFHWAIPRRPESVRALFDFLTAHPEFQLSSEVERQLQAIALADEGEKRGAAWR